MSDWKALQEQYTFLVEAESDSETKSLLAYYNERLIRDVCLCDLSLYRTGAIGLCWRNTQHVQTGKGQYICASLDCDRSAGLKSFELHFQYREHGRDKQTLVKTRLCRSCARKLKDAREVLASST